MDPLETWHPPRQAPTPRVAAPTWKQSKRRSSSIRASLVVNGTSIIPDIHSTRARLRVAPTRPTGWGCAGTGSKRLAALETGLRAPVTSFEIRTACIESSRCCDQAEDTAKPWPVAFPAFRNDLAHRSDMIALSFRCRPQGTCARVSWLSRDAGVRSDDPYEQMLCPLIGGIADANGASR